MKTEEYIHSEKMTLDNFLKLNKDEAITFDFLTQGDEPDRTRLINSIYKEIFPWYDEKLHAGDTFNTYRIAVKKFYGKYYRFLDREKQLEIVEIIERYTQFEDEHLFEFEDVDSNGNKYYQLCNNYQLGNFGILPKKYRINPLRATSPYNDFFDKFLIALSDFYFNEIKSSGNLITAIFKQGEYFNKFEDFSVFLDSNILNDFIFSYTEKNGDEDYKVENLSKVDNFEEYVSLVSKIVQARGEKMWDKLHGIEFENHQK